MAGQLLLGTGTVPATPAGGYSSAHAQSGNDAFGHALTGRIAAIDQFGALATLTPTARYGFVRNSGMWFWQRQPPATVTTYSSTAGRAFTADGWAVTNENASVTLRRVDTQGAPETGLQGRFYAEILKITATGKFEVSQVIEGTDTNSLRGRQVRVQGWLRATTGTPTYRLGLIQLNSAGTIDTIPATFISAHNGNGTDPTLGADLAYIAPNANVTYDVGTRNGNAIDCSLTTVWQRFSGVFDVPTNCKNLVVMIWTNAQVAATAGLQVSQVSLTDGAEIQDWSPLPSPLEFARCLRYIQRSFSADAAGPATNAGVNTGESRGIAGKAGAVANSGIIPVEFKPTMFRLPAVTVYNPAAANALARNITGAADMGATAITSLNAGGFYTNSTGVAATAVGDVIAINWFADGDL